MRILRRVLIGVVIALLVIVAALAASLAIDRVVMRNAVEALANVALVGPDGPLHAYLARPAAHDGDGPFALVVMIHEFWGLDEATISKAGLLAQEGYVVVAPDLMRGHTTRWLPSAIWQTLRTPDERVREDLDAVRAAFEGDAHVDLERLAVIGFCFGGRMALRYALERSEVRATGVFYGNVTDDVEALRRLAGPLLGIFGAQDGTIPLSEVRAFERSLERAGVEHEVHVFTGAGHAFVTDAEGIANDPRQARAWRLLSDFLQRHLGT